MPNIWAANYRMMLGRTSDDGGKAGMFTLYVRPAFRDRLLNVVADVTDWCADLYPPPELRRNSSRLDVPRMPEVVGRLRASLIDEGLTSLATCLTRG